MPRDEAIVQSVSFTGLDDMYFVRTSAQLIERGWLQR
jgi:hypothetical protein